MYKYIIVITLSMLTHIFASADISIKEAESNCIKQSSFSNSAMADCTSQRIVTEDEQVSIINTKLITKLNSSKRKELQLAQELWLQYREANCRYVIDPEGGSFGMSIAPVACYSSMTSRRLKDLLEDHLARFGE